MEHLSEVVKILDAALMHDPKKADAYGQLLAAKLEEDGQTRQARAVRSTLSKVSASGISASYVNAKLPVDAENALAVVDVRVPEELAPTALALHPYVRSRIDEFLELVRLHDRWAADGVAGANRLLIYGPPGTGKTSIAALIASELKLTLVTSRSDALMSSLLGQTSRNLRSVFDYAVARPCVLFLDEFDALAKSRNDSREIGELQRVVIALLQNIDALDLSTIVIAATNHAQLLDPAVWRRFEFTLQVDLPGEGERAEIWRVHLGSLVPAEAELARLVQLSQGMSGAAIELAAKDIRRGAIRDATERVTLPVMLRRLARIRWFESSSRFDDDASEIAALRAWSPEVFTVRALAELFSVSTRQVTKAMTKVHTDA